MLIGILMLMGIVTKNAILLVDFAMNTIARGMNRYEAMIEAGSKRAPSDRDDLHRDVGRHASRRAGRGRGRSFRAPMAER